MDSLRYWVTRDARRRLPLRPRLHARARAARASTRSAPFFDDRCARTRCSRRVKLIAEPWDLGDGGYQVGSFPPGWAEWNDQYRDTMRAYWKGDGGLIGEFARRLTGSQRPLRPQRPRPRARASTSSPPTTASRCTTSSRYNEKHNEANGEDNRDGTDNNAVVELRRRGPDRRPRDHARCASGRSATSSPRCCSRRACRCCSPATRSAAPRAATTTPTARTTRLSWLDWYWDDAEAAPARLHRKLIRAAQATHPIFRRRDFFHGARRWATAAARTSSGCSPTAAR